MVEVEPILSQSYGYIYILVLGFVFALIMIMITTILAKFAGEKQTSEHFTTASRFVGPEILCIGVVSSWTWPGTLLTSSGMSYSYGICGGAWYAFAFTIQITFFACVALEIKRKAPGAHTILEIVKARFGSNAHFVSMFYGIGTNVIISAMLLLGGCQAISVVTGMHIVAAAMLLPLGVWAYTVTGGLKATFISDWIHTVIIYIVILTALFVTYTSSDKIGSIDKMYDLLTHVSIEHPSAGHEGSYLTWSNKQAIFNGWNIVVGGFSTVFCDPSYAQKAIAAKPKASMIGYFTGGLCWLIIPLGLSNLALASLALVNDPDSPTYPDLIPSVNVNEGIPMLYGMYMILGKSGVAAGLLMVWLAATSATSAELIGFSSVMTYDVYRSYIKPQASGKELVRMTHIFVTFFAIAMGGLTVLFNYIGITISWIISFIGVIIGPGVFAFTLSLFWSKMTTLSWVVGPPLATVIAVISWCGSAKSLYGAVNKDTLGEQYSCAVGNFVGLFGSLILIVAISLLKPDPEPYNFDDLDKKFTVGDDATMQEANAMKVQDKSENDELTKYASYAKIISVAIFIILIFLVPLPMYGSDYIYSRGGFKAWIVIIFIWLFIAASYAIFSPVIRARKALVDLFLVGIGKKKPAQVDLLSSHASRVDSSEEVINIEEMMDSKLD